jgi:predicted enzyme involved in methoxymalonyl-ACP biosynthesis
VNSEVLKIEQKEMVHINLPRTERLTVVYCRKNSHTASILKINNEQNNNKIILESMPQIKIEEINFEENSTLQPTLPEKEFDFLSTMLEDLQNRAEKQQSLFTLESLNHPIRVENFIYNLNVINFQYERYVL